MLPALALSLDAKRPPLEPLLPWLSSAPATALRQPRPQPPHALHSSWWFPSPCPLPVPALLVSKGIHRSRPALQPNATVSSSVLPNAIELAHRLLRPRSFERQSRRSRSR